LKKENDSQLSIIKPEQLAQNKKILRRVDFDVVKRIISLLHHNSRIKKTNIAMKCKLGYDKCVLYLDWLEMMDLIRRENNEDGFEIIILSERGYEFSKKRINNF
jgi:predicted transcriptional regulator